MLDCIDRRCVEAVKSAKRITIIVDENLDTEVHVQIRMGGATSKKVTHDIALAIQDYYNRTR